ncbi:MAG: rhodanese-like domain-containing protein [Bacteroidota bacterium]
MEELKRTKRITIGTVVVVAVLIVALLIYKPPLHKYKIATADMAFELMMATPITPDEAMEFVWDSTYVFVDIRSEHDYSVYHLDNAVSIPSGKLLTKDSKKQFDQWQKDSLQVVLYGKDELQVTTPWMVLYQVGYTNTRIMMGGMEYIDMLYEGTLENEEAYNVEMPAYDYAGIIAAAASGEVTAPVVQPKKVVVRKKEKKAAEGGC